VEVYQRYLAQYRIEDALFPYTDRFIQLLFADLKKRTRIAKELTPKTLRHTHVVRAYKRGEDPERIFDRIGLKPRHNLLYTSGSLSRLDFPGENPLS